MKLFSILAFLVLFLTALGIFILWSIGQPSAELMIVLFWLIIPAVAILGACFRGEAR